MPELTQKTFQRQVAYKVKISDILGSSSVKGDFFVESVELNNVNVSRVNIIAIMVYKSENLSYASAVIDDGTGKILLRSFENKNMFLNVDVGDAVLTIGKIREFNNEKYVLPEIVKKINNIEWLNVRKLELGNADTVDSKIKTGDKNFIEGTNTGANEEIYSLIKKLDNGYGASVDDVIKNSNISEAESIINKLLESGDVFEVKPGKLKVLE